MKMPHTVFIEAKTIGVIACRDKVPLDRPSEPNFRADVFYGRGEDATLNPFN